MTPMTEAVARTMKVHEGRLAWKITGAGAGPASIQSADAAFLGEWVRERRPLRIVEVGTHVGYSTRVIGDNMPEGARFVTMDVDDFVSAAGVTAALPGVRFLHGCFRDRLPEALAELGGVDLYHDDGSHDYEDVIDAMELVIPHLSPEGAILAHDALWSNTNLFRHTAHAVADVARRHDLDLLNRASSYAVLARRDHG